MTKERFLLISTFLFWIIKDCLFLLGYISGRQSFPKPLSPKEEREALVSMSEGDEDARQKLIEHNMRLIVHIARKYKVPGCTFDDLISIGAVGLIKAVRSYKMDSGTSLSTYAARCIENEILMSLRQSRKQQSDISLSEPLGTDHDGNTVSFSDLLGTPPDLVEEEVRRRITLTKVEKELPKLPERERTVLKLRYGLEDGLIHPQHEIAEMLGISRSYVSRVEKHGIELLRESITKNGE
ncbi:MAG: RNA polymerase sporulation sigma factor SigK [Clostridiales bacterium]|nr:RNA polymerase sporulation sigma factor SigK [Clostridiales bacterium]